MRNVSHLKARSTAERSRSVGGASAAFSAVTVERILDSAEAVLMQHGYAGFTTRRVAEAAGIAPGNLSYHYPTKLELLRALIERLVTRYSGQLHAALQPSGLEPGRDVETLVRWLLEETVTVEAVRLFRELWAMALHDEVVREGLDNFYDELMDRIATTLQTAFPAADPRGIRDLVQFIALMSEGSVVLYGTRRARATPYERMIELAVRMIGVITPDLATPATDSTTEVEDGSSGQLRVP